MRQSDLRSIEHDHFVLLQLSLMVVVIVLVALRLEEDGLTLVDRVEPDFLLVSELDEDPLDEEE